MIIIKALKNRKEVLFDCLMKKMADKVNHNLQNKDLAGKNNLPSPFPSYRLILKKQSFKYIMLVKGWKNYSHAAEALGFTRQYISMLVEAKTTVSAEFITRLAVSIGNVKGNWWVHYEIVPRGNFDPNHPVWNNEKHDGKIPYDGWSPQAEARKKDYSVEQKKKFADDNDEAVKK